MGLGTELNGTYPQECSDGQDAELFLQTGANFKHLTFNTTKRTSPNLANKTSL